MGEWHQKLGELGDGCAGTRRARYAAAALTNEKGLQKNVLFSARDTFIGVYAEISETIIAERAPWPAERTARVAVMETRKREHPPYPPGRDLLRGKDGASSRAAVGDWYRLCNGEAVYRMKVQTVFVSDLHETQVG